MGKHSAVSARPLEIHDLMKAILDFVAPPEFISLRLVNKQWMGILSSRLYKALEKALCGKLICIVPFSKEALIDKAEHLSQCQKFSYCASGSIISYPSE